MYYLIFKWCLRSSPLLNTTVLYIWQFLCHEDYIYIMDKFKIRVFFITTLTQLYSMFTLYSHMEKTYMTASLHVWVNKPSSIPPLIIAMPVPSCICVYLLLFLRIAAVFCNIGLWQLGIFVFHFNSSTYHDIAEISLKFALNINQPILVSSVWSSSNILNSRISLYD